VERFNGTYRRGVINKYIFEDIHQVKERTQAWMNDYNHYRPHDALGKIPRIKYAEFNSFGASLKRIKNNNFNEVFRKLSSSDWGKLTAHETNNFDSGPLIVPVHNICWY